MDISSLKRDLSQIIDETFDEFEQTHHCLPSMEEFQRLIFSYESQFIGTNEHQKDEREYAFWCALLESEAEVRQARTNREMYC
jgi:hypothetical protein